MDAIVFEVSNEVAHRIGGIHAVIASKAPLMKKNFKKYYTVGPYDPKTLSVDFEPMVDHPFQGIFKDIEAKEGIKCVFGKWVAADRADCILIDPGGLRNRVNEIKARLWNDYVVDSLVSWELFDESVVWGEAVGIVLGAIITSHEFKNKKIICQFHEWLSGSALLHLRSANANAGLIFTTHATTMGRTMAERGEDLVKEVNDGLASKKTLADDKVRQYGAQCVHTLERACAHSADIFTTVSEVTAEEAQYILGKYPDVLTLNGLAFDGYPSMEELSISHKEFRITIKHFVQAFFSSYYPLDMEDALYFFTAGRYEFHNKGYDVLIRSLGLLNERLKREKSKKTAVVFLWVPNKTKGWNIDVLSNMSLFEAIEEQINENLDEIRDHILDSVSVGEMPSDKKMFDKPFLQNLKQMMARLKSKRGQTPPMCALELESKNDVLLRALKENGLENKEEDRVKIIYYPTYLSPADGLLGLNYNDAIEGCHLGVFPSYYEPWGYTPLETAALAVPSVTTDLAGFGRFIKNHAKGQRPAIMVLDRRGDGDDIAISQLVDYMHFILNSSRKERVKKKIEAKHLAGLADWQNLIKNYLLAYETALEKKAERLNNV